MTISTRTIQKIFPDKCYECRFDLGRGEFSTADERTCHTPTRNGKESTCPMLMEKEAKIKRAMLSGDILYYIHPRARKVVFKDTKI